MTERQRIISDNYKRVIDKIAEAKYRRDVRLGTTGAEVRLLAATKTVPVEEILFLIENFGLSLCGENRQNEFTEKHEAVQAAGAEMHFIGHLQTNKLKYVIGKTELIHSVDSLHLAREINKKSVELGIKTGILVEVNIGREESKTGLLPENVGALLGEIRNLPGLSVRGMMAMAPKTDEKEEIREYFRKSYGIFLDFCRENKHNIDEPVLSGSKLLSGNEYVLSDNEYVLSDNKYVLSMGMSDSYETAIEEGSTLVRVGSAIFGERTYK